MIRTAMLATGLLISTSALSGFLPANNLHLQDSKNAAANMTEAEFMEITNLVINTYKPFAQLHGATLNINANWGDSTVNASAQQSFGTWHINMYGGLARRPEVTKDGYAMVVCHELGHHFAGFPFVSSWAGNEGSADYFSTQVCAPKLWASDLEANVAHRDTVDTAAKVKCDSKFTNEDRQNLCYRITMGGKSLATLMGALTQTGSVAVETPDTSVVSVTNNRHPAAQCRFDTYISGALCDIEFNDEIIPGKTLGRGSREAEEQAYQYSCARRDGHTENTRPLCWYKPSVL